MLLRSRRRWLLLVAVLLCAASGVHASGLQVGPTLLSLAADRNADGIWLSNTGDAELHAQVRVYAWTQEGAEDKLAPSRGLAISPPMLQLAPGARQLVRVIRTGAPPASNESAFRIVVDELPVDAPAKTEAATPASGSGSALRFVLRYSVPVFLEPATSTSPALSATLHAQGPKPMLEVTNTGSMHAQLGNLALVTEDGRRIDLVPGLLGYVLPGSTMRWPVEVPADALAHGGRLLSRINGEAGEHTLASVEPAR